MKRTPVTSECLASVGYDGRRQILEVKFTQGDVYRYFGVAAKIHRGLLAAASQGKFYQQNIREAGYRYKRVK
jgi:hypothetical protein